MIIPISGIPHEGQHFQFDEDNIQVKGFIYPLKNGFDINGEIVAELKTECSFCTKDMSIPVREKFHEMMMLGGKISRQVKEVEIDPHEAEIHYVTGNEVDIRPIVDELIEVNMPIQPCCTSEVTAEGKPVCIKGSHYEKYLQNNPETPLKNPFEVLKNLKKN